MDNYELDEKEKFDKLNIMRIVALAVLGFVLYWFFSDIELNKMELRSVPMLYPLGDDFYGIKKSILLIMPVLFNCALWIPRYESYIFIRSVLYTEFIKNTFFLIYYSGGILITLPMNKVFLKSAYLMVIIMVVYLYLIKKINKELKKEKYQQYFKVDSKHEEWTKFLAGTIVVVMFVGVYMGVMFEDKSQWIAAIYRSRETRVTDYDKVKLIDENKKWIYSNSNISPDGEKLLLTYDGKAYMGIDIFDMEKGEKLVNINGSLSNMSFTPDNNHIIRMNYGKARFEIINLETGATYQYFQDRTALKEERNKTNQDGSVYKIKISPSGKYFAADISNDGGIEVWDYKSGKLIDYYGIGGNIREVVWLSENKFITVKAILDKYTNIKDKEIVVHEILDDGSVKRSKNEKMSEQIKARGFLNGSIVEANNGKEVFFEERSNDYFEGYRQRLNLYNVETDEVNFELTLRGFTSIDIDENGRLFVTETFSSGKRKITQWNLEQRKKEKTIYIKVKQSKKGLVDQGKKMVFIGSAVKMVDLE